MNEKLKCICNYDDKGLCDHCGQTKLRQWMKEGKWTSFADDNEWHKLGILAGIEESVEIIKTYKDFSNSGTNRQNESVAYTNDILEKVIRNLQGLAPIIPTSDVKLTDH